MLAAEYHAQEHAKRVDVGGGCDLLFGKLLGGGESQALERIAAEELADLRGQVNAIGRSQAVIEFALDGTILTGNENFLRRAAA